MGRVEYNSPHQTVDKVHGKCRGFCLQSEWMPFGIHETLEKELEKTKEELQRTRIEADVYREILMTFALRAIPFAKKEAEDNPIDK